MSKIPVYFMPGLAASSIIFENIKLPEDTFEMHFLEWFVHKYLLHGLGKKKNSFLAFHWSGHHKESRKNNFKE